MGASSEEIECRAKRPSRPFVYFEKNEIDQSIPDRFEKQVAANARQLAVKARHSALTYNQLNINANQIASSLLNERTVGCEPIGLLLPQSTPLIAAILGVLKSGNAYFAQDPSLPSAYIRHTVSDLEISALITDEAGFDLANSAVAGSIPIYVLSDLISDGAVENPDISISSDSLAYLYSTSGSTGRAKAVADTHRNVLHNIMRYTNSLGIGKDDRLSLLQSASFSGSVSSLFCALLNGATVFPYDVPTEGIGQSLAAWINREQLTMYHSVPAIFRSLGTLKSSFPSIRTIRLEGDTATKQDVEIYRECFEPDCVLVNGLGSTETGICRQFFVNKDTQLQTDTIPVGYPVKDMDVLLLDDEDRQVDVGEIGEIVVRSEYLADGYWRDADLTNKSFRQVGTGGKNRLYRSGDLGRLHIDGCLEHLGRKDFQPKVRGHHVDVFAVEEAIRAHPEIRDVVVLVAPALENAEARLVAHLVAIDKSKVSSKNIRQLLAESVPPYLVPSVFIFLDELPLDPNGKVDRRALRKSTPARPMSLSAPTPPRGELERELVSLWEDVLGISPIGVHDNFFDLGGDSLAALTLQSMLDLRGFGASETPLLAEVPTISQLAVRIGSSQAQSNVPVVAELQPHGANPPLFCVHDPKGTVTSFGKLSRYLGHDQPLYGLQLLAGHPEDPATTIEDLAARHVAAIRNIQPNGPYCIAGNCFGAVVGLEIARQLQSLGARVSMLACLNITAYDFPGLVSQQAMRRYRFGLKGKLFYVIHKRARWRWLLHMLRSNLTALRWNLQASIERRLGRRWSLNSTARSLHVLQGAFEQYNAQPYEGRASLFLPALPTSLYTDNPELDWQGLATDGVTVQKLPLDGRALFNDPQILQVLADGLLECIESTSRNASGERS